MTITSKFTEHIDDDSLIFENEKSVSLEDILRDVRTRSMSTSSSASNTQASSHTASPTSPTSSSSKPLFVRRWTSSNKNKDADR